MPKFGGIVKMHEMENKIVEAAAIIVVKAAQWVKYA